MRVKTVIEFGLTAVVLFMVYKFATNGDVAGDIQNKVINAQMQGIANASAQSAFGSTSKNSVYQSVSGETDINVLSRKARSEANRILKSGDVNALQDEFQNNPFLQKMMEQQKQ